jgi:hypothetical protein
VRVVVVWFFQVPKELFLKELTQRGCKEELGSKPVHLCICAALKGVLAFRMPMPSGHVSLESSGAYIRSPGSKKAKAIDEQNERHDWT